MKKTWLFVASIRRGPSAAAPLGRGLQAAMALLLLVVLAIAASLSLAFVVVGLLVAVPILITRGLGRLGRGRKPAAGSTVTVIEIPAVPVKTLREPRD